MIYKILCLCVALCCSHYALADSYVSNPTVIKNLIKVHEVASEIGAPVETMQAILLKESTGGLGGRVGSTHLPPSQRSYGIMQVTPIAARSVLGHGKLSDSQLIARLTVDDEFNIRIASQHLVNYLSQCGGNWAKAVAAYNMGIGNANKFSNHVRYGYVVWITKTIDNTIRPFNNKYIQKETSHGNTSLSE